MPALPDLGAALLLGLLGGGHCIGMCGGIGAALAFALGPRCSTLRRHLLLVLYSCGRISSYVLMGALAGGVLQLGSAGGALPVARIAAGVLLVVTGLALAGWSQALGLIERAGGVVWRRLQGIAARLGPPDRAPVALAAGALWGWLPCGLVYGALAWSGAAGGGSAARSAVLMLGFGIGTLPAVLASGVLADRLRALLQRRGLRLVAALCLCAFGVWTAVAALGGAAGTHAHHH